MGQILGEQIRPGDLVVNIVTAKKLTNMRASGSDGTIQIIPKKNFSLEEALECVQEDEYLGNNAKIFASAQSDCLDENEGEESREIIGNYRILIVLL